MDTIEYWKKNMVNRSQATRKRYLDFIRRYCEWVGNTPDEIISMRKDDLSSDDLKERHRFELELKGFISYLQEEGYSVSTQQVAYAGIRSFFDVHFMPLNMRKNDYPSGESLGHRPATKNDLRKLLEIAEVRWKAVLSFLKDSGLRISDVVGLTYGDVKKGLDENDEFIPITTLTKKKKVVARTFIGQDAIESLIEYLEHRKTGTRKLPPEIITDATPLFSTKKGGFRPMLPNSMSAGIFNLMKRAGLNGDISAHSLRKYFQTQLESAGVNGNWIMQMIGHSLNGVENHYSRPTEQMLLEAYKEAYDALRIEPKAEDRIKILEEQLEEERRKRLVLENSIHTQEKKLEPYLKILEETYSSLVNTAESMDLGGTVITDKSDHKNIKPKLTHNTFTNKERNNNHNARNNNNHKLISENELVQFLDEGWEIKTTLSSGKIVIHKS
jgi:integrase